MPEVIRLANIVQIDHTCDECDGNMVFQPDPMGMAPPASLAAGTNLHHCDKCDAEAFLPGMYPRIEISVPGGGDTPPLIPLGSIEPKGPSQPYNPFD